MFQGCTITVGYRTDHNSLYILSMGFSAHENPDDYTLVTGELRDGDMQINRLEISKIRHAPSRDNRSIDKIIDAKWQEVSKFVSLRLGRRALVIEQDQDGKINRFPLEPIG